MANQFYTFQNCSKEVSMLVPIPKYIKLVHEHEELRDGVNVEIHRYQAEEPLNYGGFSYIQLLLLKISKHTF